MALPAGRYGVTKNQLLKIKKLPMNTIKLIEELTEKFDLLGTAAFKNSTSVVTQSTDLVESGAVFDALGFGNKNLFNKNAVENGIIGENGTIVIIGEWKSSEFIKVTPSEKYIISGLNVSYSSSAGFAFYNSAKTFVSGGWINDFKNTPITIPDNVEYIRFSLVPADLDTAQLEVGSTATAYEPYHASVSDSLAEKADNSVIGTVEDDTTASQAYAVGSHAIRNGAFITWKNAKAQGETINDASDYTVGDVASVLSVSESALTDVIGDVNTTKMGNHLYKYGNVVEMDLSVTNVTCSAFANLAVIPEGYRPANGDIRFNDIDGRTYKTYVGGIQPSVNLSNNEVQIHATWITN